MKFNQTKELILQTLHKNGEMTALELAEILNRDKRTIGSLLLHYEKQGLLTRKDKPYLWGITQKGMNRLALGRNG